MAALLDDAALARILDAADRELYVPDDFERDDVRNDLRNDLEGAATFYRTGKALRVQPRKRRQRVKQIVETAKYLQALVAQGGQWIGFTDISKALDQLIKDVRRTVLSQTGGAHGTYLLDCFGSDPDVGGSSRVCGGRNRCRERKKDL